MKKEKNIKLKIIYKNKLDVTVFDDHFYSRLLEKLKTLKDSEVLNKEENKNS